MPSSKFFHRITAAAPSLFLLSLLANQSVSATTIYAEPADLPNNIATPLDLGPLDTGINTIIGGVSGTWSGGSWSGDTRDAFAYTVPHGIKVTAFELNATNFTTNVFSVFGESATTTAGVDTLFFDDNGSWTNLLTDGGPLSAGTYNYALEISPSCPGCFSGNLSFDWTVNITAEIDEVLYAEPADLSNNLNTPTDLGDLRLGLNKVRGGVSGSWSEGSPGSGHWNGDATDAFGYTVPAGMMVSNFELTISNFATNVFSVFGEPETTTGGVDDSIFFGDDAFWPNILTSGYLPEGDYDFGLTLTPSCLGCISANMSYDWEAILTLAICGDLDNDGFVGITDLNIVLSKWNQAVTPGSIQDGDVNGDGFVGIEDLNKVLGNWNAGTPPSTASIPEPATLGVLMMSAAAFTRRPRSRRRHGA